MGKSAIGNSSRQRACRRKSFLPTGTGSVGVRDAARDAADVSMEVHAPAHHHTEKPAFLGEKERQLYGSGVDGGGLFKEFLEELVKEGYSPEAGLFRAVQRVS